MDAVAFPTADGVRLEGELRVPDEHPRGSAVICHAHPRHGGSKDHPVLWAVRSELAGKRGLVALVFNFRGTMGSGGSFGGGREEVLDVRAAIGFVRERVEGGKAPLCHPEWRLRAWPTPARSPERSLQRSGE